jgi:hypothetical protein
VVSGRAWSGVGTIERVEVSDDGGSRWDEAELGPGDTHWAWRPWRWAWSPTAPGDYELCCRATDSGGNTQPLQAPWNLHGFANNEVQRVPVTIKEEGQWTNSV